MDDRFLSLIHNTIEENISNENFNVEELVQTVGLSRSMLHRKLKGLTGKSASDLITEKRLARAKELLENNVATAAEIAFKVGFSDHSYYTKCFHELYGVITTEFIAGKKRYQCCNRGINNHLQEYH